MTTTSPKTDLSDVTLEGAPGGARKEEVRQGDAAAVGRTPGPWEYVPGTEHHGPYITSQYGNTIADLYVMSEPGERSFLNGGPSKPLPFLHEMADPNAAFIAKAANSHDALVDACKKVREWLCYDGPIQDDGITHPAFIKANNAVLAALKLAGEA